MNLINNKYSIKELECIIDNNVLSIDDWYNISRYQILTEEFIDKYSDRVYWTRITCHQKLSESFIEKYSDKIDWYYISKKQNLSESFIERSIDKFYWNMLIKYQPLSYSFLEKHLYQYELYIDYTVNSEHLDKLSKKYPDKYEVDKLAYELRYGRKYNV